MAGFADGLAQGAQIGMGFLQRQQQAEKMALEADQFNRQHELNIDANKRANQGEDDRHRKFRTDELREEASYVMKQFLDPATGKYSNPTDEQIDHMLTKTRLGELYMQNQVGAPLFSAVSGKKFTPIANPETGQAVLHTRNDRGENEYFSANRKKGEEPLVFDVQQARNGFRQWFAGARDDEFLKREVDHGNKIKETTHATNEGMREYSHRIDENARGNQMQLDQNYNDTTRYARDSLAGVQDFSASTQAQQPGLAGAYAGVGAGQQQAQQQQAQQQPAPQQRPSLSMPKPAMSDATRLGYAKRASDLADDLDQRAANTVDAKQAYMSTAGLIDALGTPEFRTAYDVATPEVRARIDKHIQRVEGFAQARTAEAAANNAAMEEGAARGGLAGTFQQAKGWFGNLGNTAEQINTPLAKFQQSGQQGLAQAPAPYQIMPSPQGVPATPQQPQQGGAVAVSGQYPAPQGRGLSSPPASVEDMVKRRVGNKGLGAPFADNVAAAADPQGYAQMQAEETRAKGLAASARVSESAQTKRDQDSISKTIKGMSEPYLNAYPEKRSEGEYGPVRHEAVTFLNNYGNYMAMKPGGKELIRSDNGELQMRGAMEVWNGLPDHIRKSPYAAPIADGYTNPALATALSETDFTEKLVGYAKAERMSADGVGGMLRYILDQSAATGAEPLEVLAQISQNSR